jgi:hypothetical protein
MTSVVLRDFLRHLEADPTLFEPDQLRRRIDALDQLDRMDAEPSDSSAAAIRERLEAANAAVYESIRSQIQRSSGRDALLPWIEHCADPADLIPTGLHYDCLDELIGGVLPLREPDSANIYPSPEMIFFQPTPARHILRMIRLSAPTEADTLIDLGSGLGHVPILVSLLTGARGIGVEVEPAYVASARGCTESLGLSRAIFMQQDAREADLSVATVVYLYTPFTGSILGAVLHKLREQSVHQPLRICTFGPCTQIVAREPWLAASTAIADDQIAIFHVRG